MGASVRPLERAASGSRVWRESTPLGARSARVAEARSSARVVMIIERSEEHTSELQSQSNLVCRLLLEKKKNLCASMRPALAMSFALCVVHALELCAFFQHVGDFFHTRFPHIFAVFRSHAVPRPWLAMC